MGGRGEDGDNATMFCLLWCLVSPQGIFGVGQSTAKFINKETNIRTMFRCVSHWRAPTVCGGGCD